ncbi:MAG: DUF2007 domain-containing protein [Candidatus Paceibacterota bacterium]
MKKSDMIQIYNAEDRSSAELVKGYLENNEIEALIEMDSSRGIHGNPGGDSPLVGWKIYVSKEKEEQAKELLKEFKEKESNN